MSDPFSPDAALLVALGSAIVHAEEFLSPTGHPADKQAFDSVLSQPNVREWMDQMKEMAMLPVKRLDDLDIEQLQQDGGQE